MMSNNTSFSAQFKLLFFTLLLSGFSGFAQDKIIKKGGETLEVKILEVGPNEIKYKLFSEPEGPIFIMDKDRIVEVVFENGRIEKYVSPLKDTEFYVDQKKRALKMNFISPLLGYTQVAYEQNLKPGRSYEVSLGIIGLGRNQELEYWNGTTHKENQAGVFGSFGYKFKRVPDFTANNQKYGHILQGFYVKPELMIGYLSNDGFNYDTQTSVKRKTTFGAALVNLGKQWVFSDSFVIDLYGGLGYALKTRSDNDGDYYNSEGRLYGVITGSDDADFAVSGGFRIGFLLK
ncbi:hypothetical protein FLAN108750_05540 [Flavobacterium antarcticum]|uniref:hypothetical protein n=1 Tax=Flavobacterium antarcticum TaxID=271155 RepID=UPI0003B65410|nr:hypothetical protein [Flavobacterium antarcticum]